MKHLHQRFSFSGQVVLVGLCGMGAILAAPAQAQTNTGGNYDATTLSDVAGPFHGNVNIPISPLTPPANIGVSISTLDNTARDILISPQEPNLGRVVKVCVQLSASLAKVAPFSGCSNVNWKAYNRAVADTKQLKRELNHELQLQTTALGGNPSDEERTDILQRLELLERTTTALESSAKALMILGQAIDKAR